MKALRYAVATLFGLIAAGVILLGALMVFVGIYATWAYQDDPSSAQNLILVPGGFIIGAPGWAVAYLAYLIAPRTA